MSIWSRIFQKKQSKPTDSTQSEEPCGERPDTEATHANGPLRLKTVGDFLKLIGVRVRFDTKQGESFEATVRDLSDAGTHVLLDDVLRIESPNMPGLQVMRVARKDLVDTGDLLQYVGKRIRLETKSPGFVEGILHSTPKTAEYLELSMVNYYHPCDKHSVLISELDFVEVLDRRAISW